MVEGVPSTATVDWMKLVFSQWGSVTYVSLPKFSSGRCKGFAFVEMDTPASALKVLQVFGEVGLVQDGSGEGGEAKPPPLSFQLHGISEKEAKETLSYTERAEPRSLCHILGRPSQDQGEKGLEEGEIDATEEDEEDDGEGGGEIGKEEKWKKKKRRKRKKKGKVEIEIPALLGFHVMPKVEWKRCRNRYLTLQRMNYGALKKTLEAMRQQASSVPVIPQFPVPESISPDELNDGQKKQIGPVQPGEKPQAWSDSGDGKGKAKDDIESETLGKEERGGERKKKREEKLEKEFWKKISFQPGVIVKILQEIESNESLRIIKELIRSCVEPEEINVRVNSDSIYVRCKDSISSARLASSPNFTAAHVLSGVEEALYWQAMRDAFIKEHLVRKEDVNEEKILEKKRKKERKKKKMLRRGKEVLKKQAEAAMKSYSHDHGQKSVVTGMGSILGTLDLETEPLSENEEGEVDDLRRLSNHEYIYETLFMNGVGSDVIIVALGHDWNLHKQFLMQCKLIKDGNKWEWECVLVLQSPYFASMFSGAWRESEESVIEIPITDPLITKNSLRLVLGSLYRKEVEVSPAIAMSVVATARIFQLDDLVQKCEELLTDTIYAQTLLLKVMKDPELRVVSMEMNLYSILAVKLYLDRHPSLNVLNLSFKAILARNEKCKGYLDSQKGASYQELFKSLRLRHLLIHPQDLKRVRNDRIIPWPWLSPHLSLNLRLLHCVESGLDCGPTDEDTERFNEESIRCSRHLPVCDTYCWRWGGYLFGLDLLVLVTKEQSISISVKDETSPRVRNSLPRTFLYRVVMSNRDENGREIASKQSAISRCTFMDEDRIEVFQGFQGVTGIIILDLFTSLLQLILSCANGENME
ncbi:unnamed protein product [Darwinula stevensoni]|uniref:Uncharacterized protein n=1 Tax=Darwinula stevensoni TaxID=69355 RepID=A0A7R9A4B5_9CRUS|nr:unnamed protein product [Darwinula stevensoni]CAG0883925.1 unnamed protein product [Darwinula stevensoni]